MRVLLALALSVATAAAQQIVLRPEAYDEQPEPARVVVEVDSVLAKHARNGPAGYATVTLQNPDARSHVVELWFRSMWHGQVLQRDRVALEPRQSVTRSYPLMQLDATGLRVVVSCDGFRESSEQLAQSQLKVGVLLVSNQSSALTGLVDRVLEGSRFDLSEKAPGRRSASRSFAEQITTATPSQLPDRWQAFAGFDCIVLDGRVTLDEPRQRVVLDALAAGVALYVYHAAALPKGPLAQACAAAAPGFGRLRVQSGDHDVGDQDWFAAVLTEGGERASGRGASGPAPDWFYVQLNIPGLGSVPLFAFLVVSAVFVLLAGPVNFLLCRRAGRPVLTVLTVPLLGFGFAAAILAWGLFAEGLGVVGARQSLTWLDQRDHYAVTHTSRTLYAGLQPASLTPQATSLVGLLGSARVGRQQRYELDHVTGQLDGAVLPSRTPTQIVTVTPQRLRERLRFRRLPNGDLDVLAAPALAPRAPAMVVRDHGGQCYLGEVQGDRVVLRRCPESDAVAFVRDQRMAFGVWDSNWAQHDLHNAGFHRASGDPRAEFNAWLERNLAGLEPGSFLAWTTAHPGVDDLGLEVTWRAERHMVFGKLAEEDFVD